jgi:hypothetical protein
LILQFSTPWPKKRFGVKRAEVAAEYEQAVILTALSRILLFFLGSLLRFHTLAQDIFLQTVCNSGLGLLGMWFIRLFAISPALLVAVLVALSLVSWLLVRFVSGKNNAMRSRLASLVNGESLAGQPASADDLTSQETATHPSHRSQPATQSAAGAAMNNMTHTRTVPGRAMIGTGVEDDVSVISPPNRELWIMDLSSSEASDNNDNGSSSLGDLPPDAILSEMSDGEWRGSGSSEWV